MKAYMNGQKRTTDTLMATKYQLGKVYTKVLSLINSVNDDLTSLSTQVLEKERALINKDNELSNDISSALISGKTYTNNVSSALSTVVDTRLISTSGYINTVSSTLSTVVDTRLTSTSGYINAVSGNLNNSINYALNTANDYTDFVSGKTTENLLHKDFILKQELSTYVDTSIENLGSIYELIGTLPDGTIADHISALPTNPLKGDIYFVNNVLADGAILTQQYICINDEPGTNVNNKWQKFGTSTDLSRYYTRFQTDTLINESLHNANIYSDERLNDANNYTNGKFNTANELIVTTANNISGCIRGVSSYIIDTEIYNLKDYTDNKFRTTNELIATTANNISGCIRGVSSYLINTEIYNTKIELKNYIDGQDTNILNSAKLHSDNNLTNAKDYTDLVSTLLNNNEIHNALLLAESYTDQTNVTTLNAANGYTNNVANNINGYINNVSGILSGIIDERFITTKNYSDSQDAATLDSAKIYSNNKLIDAKDYVDYVSSQLDLHQIKNAELTAINHANTTVLDTANRHSNDNLVAAKTYTDQVSTALNTTTRTLSGILYTTIENVSGYLNDTAINDAKNDAKNYALQQKADAINAANNSANYNLSVISTYLINNLIYNAKQEAINHANTNVLNAANRYSNDNLVLAKQYTDGVSTILSGTIDNHLWSTSGYIKEVSGSLNTIISDLRTELANSDSELNNNLTDYIDRSIESLGTTFEFKGMANSYSDLPGDAKKGEIYLVNNILPDNSVETVQYVSITNAVATGSDKWQKIGTSVDLTNYYTISQILNTIDGALHSATSYTDLQIALSTAQLTTILSNTIISNALQNAKTYAKNYALQQKSDAIDIATRYTDYVSGYLMEHQILDAIDSANNVVLNSANRHSDDNLFAANSNANNISRNLNTTISTVSGLLNTTIGTISSYLISNLISNALQNAKTYAENYALNQKADAINSTNYNLSVISTYLINNLIYNAKQEAINHADTNVLNTANRYSNDNLVLAKQYTDGASTNLNTTISDVSGILNTTIGTISSYLILHQIHDAQQNALQNAQVFTLDQKVDAINSVNHTISEISSYLINNQIRDAKQEAINTANQYSDYILTVAENYTDDINNNTNRYVNAVSSTLSTVVDNRLVIVRDYINDNLFAYSGSTITTLNDSNLTINPTNGMVYKHILTNNDNITIERSNLSLIKQITFELHLIQPATAVTFTLPNDLMWCEGNVFDSSNLMPSMNSASTLYCIVVRWDGTNLLANLAYSKILG